MKRQTWTISTPQLGEWYWFTNPMALPSRSRVALQWTEAEERHFPWQVRVRMCGWQRSWRALKLPAMPDPMTLAQPIP
jgi:hypothetical protein